MKSFIFLYIKLSFPYYLILQFQCYLQFSD